MGWNGSGSVSRSDGTRTGSNVWQQARDAGVDILAADHDSHDEDLATAIENCVTRDGQNAATADLPMGGFNHTDIDNAAARDQYAAAGQVQDGSLKYIATTSGSSNAYTGSLSPAITAYAAGMQIIFKANHTNTGAATYAVNGLAARDIKLTDGTTDPEANDIVTDYWYMLTDTGTVFILTRLSNQLVRYTKSTWTPTVAADGSMTVTSTTLWDSVYQQVGNEVSGLISGTATLGGTASGIIEIPAPVSGTAQHLNSTYGGAEAKDGDGTFLDKVQWQYDGTNLKLFINGGGTNWTLGSSFTFNLPFKYYTS